MSLLDQLVNTIHRGGVVMYPMIALAFVVFFLIVERWLYLRNAYAKSTEFARRFFPLLERGEIDEARGIIAHYSCPISRMAAAGMESLELPKEDVRSILQEVALADIPKLERFLNVIAVIGTMMPILGLLGTVTGMIATFDVITVKGTGDPRALAGGISQALITTEAGLVFALPIILLHSFLSSRVDTLLAEMERAQTAFLNLYRGAGKDGGRRSEDIS